MKAQKKKELQAQAQICNDMIASILNVFTRNTGGIIKTIDLRNREEGGQLFQDVRIEVAIPDEKGTKR